MEILHKKIYTDFYFLFFLNNNYYYLILSRIIIITFKMFILKIINKNIIGHSKKYDYFQISMNSFNINNYNLMMKFLIIYMVLKLLEPTIFIMYKRIYIYMLWVKILMFDKKMKA